jgi:Outer membrane cobalamin receptor protein
MHVRRKPGAKRLCAALLAAMSLPAAAQETNPGGETAGAETANDTRTLDRIAVTGTRIKRAEAEEALPITTLDRERIDQLGITSAEQLLMTLNIAGNGSDNLASNAGIVNEEQRGNNGVSGANLRGQGADATLVLLNGRRVATHGLKGRAVDLNSIPFAAIERVEVLRDGASAIYGTDAIGGVIELHHQARFPRPAGLGLRGRHRGRRRRRVSQQPAVRSRRHRRRRLERRSAR